MKKRRGWIYFLMVLIFGLTFGLAGCDDGDDGPPGPPGPPGPVGSVGDTDAAGSINAQWQESGHADAEAEAFNHWNEEGEVEAECARCHSTDGFVSYAMDGIVEEPVATGQVINCGACHSTTLYDDYYDFAGEGGALEPVEFPSGDTATFEDSSNMCMVCHQGRASMVQVNNAIETEDFGFINIHYFPAAATLFGADVRGGYQYEGNEYVGQFSHVPSRDTCVECHMGSNANHTFRPQAEDCASCHDEIDAEADEPFQAIRRGSTADYDGDGDTEEGLYGEINDLIPALLASMQDYTDVNNLPGIVYDSGSYPYFFVDLNDNREADADEANFGNRYTEFDAELTRAAYNYQVAQKDACGYIHNAKYIIQLLYDSIEATGGDVTALTRPAESGTTGIVPQWESSGHADVTGEAFNHWNDATEDPEGIPTACAKCHSRDGFRDFAEDGEVTDPVAPVLNEAGDQVTQDSTLTCGACHVHDGVIAATTDPTTLWESEAFGALEPVTFPSGATATFNGPSNMCASCHQGRESGVSVQESIDTADTHSFINRHYFAAAAILFGSDVTAAYEYPERSYVGQNTYVAHPDSLKTCTGCHMDGEAANHSFVPEISRCNGCHAGVTSFEEIGINVGQDYDGDGTVEGFQAELDAFKAELLTQIQDYAANDIGTMIEYTPGAYPYFVVSGTTNGYQAFDDTLLPAAFNYHSAQDPCNDMHNIKYAIQTLYDSIDSLDDDQMNNSVTINGNTAIRPDGADGGDGDGDGNGDGEVDGAALFVDNCGGCHQGNTLGTGTIGPDLTDATVEELNAMLSAGHAGFTADSFTAEEIQAMSDSLTGEVPPPSEQPGEEEPPADGDGVAPDTVVYENDQGNVTFNHASHVSTLNDCMACHTQDPPEPIAIDNTGATAAHDFCRTCHTTMGAPNSCGDCHGN